MAGTVMLISDKGDFKRNIIIKYQEKVIIWKEILIHQEGVQFINVSATL